MAIPTTPLYLFNLGAALLRSNSFDEAVKRLDAASDGAPPDKEVQELLTRAQDRVTQPGRRKTSRPRAPEAETRYRRLPAAQSDAQPKGK